MLSPGLRNLIFDVLLTKDRDNRARSVDEVLTKPCLMSRMATIIKKGHKIAEYEQLVKKAYPECIR